MASSSSSDPEEDKSTFFWIESRESALMASRNKNVKQEMNIECN